ncbi:neuralized-like protein 4 [Ischnura elegans]|uniref:neuralized-like protein 4 n=1 Tax=Ischnura elegans TaxID=197161 RepID=UPI001ED8BB55|nr:neuralized-like protein 4 [Ischnura elegans]
MRDWEAYTALQTLLFVSTLAQLERSCPADESRRNSLTISFHRRLNDSDGQWMTTFSAHAKDEVDSPAGLRMDATHTAVECSGIRDINVEITVRDVPANQTTSRKDRNDRIMFHHRHGPNVVVFNGGLSAQRINLENFFNCAVFTNRPLKDDELFEMRVDKRYADKSHCHGIGVMSHSPDDIKFYDSMYQSAGTWIYYNKHVYGGNKIIVENYGTDACGIQVGETIGVMKRANGSLHFFYNGIDQGPAITNAPSVVYGVYEVRGFSAIATIVNRK